jgi:hypothetical protein
VEGLRRTRPDLAAPLDEVLRDAPQSVRTSEMREDLWHPYAFEDVEQEYAYIRRHVYESQRRVASWTYRSIRQLRWLQKLDRLTRARFISVAFGLPLLLVGLLAGTPSTATDLFLTFELAVLITLVVAARWATRQDDLDRWRPDRTG